MHYISFGLVFDTECFSKEAILVSSTAGFVGRSWNRSTDVYFVGIEFSSPGLMPGLKM